ncbi:hypothetical protein Tco_1091733 [Tanacetum coccineum]|uniref:Reverse transcriptase domain-containing protein n=1 Tax=Tanacetum coccineum TaxID=301880 RepID=A0ABQ5I7V2_9ASTR
MRVSTNAPPTSSNSSSNFEFQQMAAALEDKMTLTFRNEMNEMKNMMKAFVPTPVPIKAVEESQPSTSTATSKVPYHFHPVFPSKPKGEVRSHYDSTDFLTHQFHHFLPPFYDVNEPLTEKETEVLSFNLMPLVYLEEIDFPVLKSTRMDPRVPLILGRPFLSNAKSLIDVIGEELVIRDGLERIVFKPDGSQDNESIHMMDVYDDRFKDVCEPESNNDSTTSAIVDEFESLLGDIIKQKEELKGISDLSC